MISRKYFGEAISFDFPNVALFQAPIRQRLLELAKSLLKGAFNEILLASVRDSFFKHFHILQTRCSVVSGSP